MDGYSNGSKYLPVKYEYKYKYLGHKDKYKYKYQVLHHCPKYETTLWRFLGLNTALKNF